MWILLPTLTVNVHKLRAKPRFYPDPSWGKESLVEVCLSFKPFSGRGGRPWLIYSPPWTHNNYNPPTFLCARVAAHCKSYLLLEIFGHRLSSMALRSIFKKNLTLTLFPSIKNLADSWDGCRVFALHGSPGATWAVQCHAGCRWAVRHTRVQLLDFHITTYC